MKICKIQRYILLDNLQKRTAFKKIIKKEERRNFGKIQKGRITVLPKFIHFVDIPHFFVTVADTQIEKVPIFTWTVNRACYIYKHCSSVFQNENVQRMAGNIFFKRQQQKAAFDAGLLRCIYQFGSIIYTNIFFRDIDLFICFIRLQKLTNLIIRFAFGIFISLQRNIRIIRIHNDISLRFFCKIEIMRVKPAGFNLFC